MKKATNTGGTTTARKRGGASSRNKGNRAERLLVALLRELGLPAQRVLGSGSFIGAKSDVKVGVRLRDGKYPPADESESLMRVEVKNRKTNPESWWLAVENIIATLGPDVTEVIYSYYNQDAISKAVVLHRPRVPQGSASDPNQVFMVAMGLKDWVELVKRAYPDAVAYGSEVNDGND